MMKNYLEMVQSVERDREALVFLTMFIPTEILWIWRWNNKGGSAWREENNSLL